jgi:hypothetical protein
VKTKYIFRCHKNSVVKIQRFWRRRRVQMHHNKIDRDFKTKVLLIQRSFRQIRAERKAKVDQAKKSNAAVVIQRFFKVKRKEETGKLMSLMRELDAFNAKATESLRQDLVNKITHVYVEYKQAKEEEKKKFEKEQASLSPSKRYKM